MKKVRIRVLVQVENEAGLLSREGSMAVPEWDASPEAVSRMAYDLAASGIRAAKNKLSAHRRKQREKGK